MTSKNSFLTSSKENHKRRMWVWIISILVQVIFYPGEMIVYLSRINAWNANGAYRSEELFRTALKEAVADAVGFNPNALIPAALLAVLIAVQGFSYLCDRKKVDMYQSVPIPQKRRFGVIYVNGILIYLLPVLLGILLALAIALPQGAVSGSAIIECLLAFVLNFIYFLVVYHIAILAVMMTGNIVITGFATATFLFIGYAAAGIKQIWEGIFFDRADYFFTDFRVGKFSIIMDYLTQINELKMTDRLADAAKEVVLLAAGWAVGALIILAIAYFCYLKRPAESAGKAIAFNVTKPFIKIIISVIVALAAYWIMQDATYENVTASVIGMIAAALICCAVMESIFEFDIRASFKHFVSTGIAAGICLLIFCIYCFDIFGYDSYVPDADKVESVAIDLGSYQRYWTWADNDESISSLSENIYIKENMFLTDASALCELAQKGLKINPEEPEADSFIRQFSVLYRLKSGREVSRRIWIDWNDPSNEELLNRLIGTKEYREGYYQIFKNPVPFEAVQKNMYITYTNGALESEMPPMEAEALQNAWIKDMEQFDFSMARTNQICGIVNWGITGEYVKWELPVYESFTNTISLLKQYDAYYPLQLRAEDIEKIEITNYHYSDEENFQYTDAVAKTVDYEIREVTAYFDNSKEIEEIARNLYPQDLTMYWNGANMTDIDYQVVITFKPDTEYPYGRGYFYYRFLNGQVPDFVEKATAHTRN